MLDRPMKFIAVLCGLALVGAWPAVVVADDARPAPVASEPSKAERLDALFADLKAATSESEGRAIEHDIIGLWTESGDDRVDRLMRRATAAINAHEFVIAVSYLDAVIGMMPDYAEGWNKRATVFYMVHRYDDSIADIGRTLALEPRHFAALAGLGMIMLSVGEKEQALAAFNAALAINPTLTRVKEVAVEIEEQLRKGI